MLRGLFVEGERGFNQIWAGPELEEVGRLIDIYAPRQEQAVARAQPQVLHDMDVLLSGWEPPLLDEQFLDAAPNLKLFLYGAGSVRKALTEAFWERDIKVCSAWGANALPVAEFTLSQIFACLKGVWQYALQAHTTGRYPQRQDYPGAYGSTVGLISLGMIGRRVCQLLKPFDLKVIAYDPFMSEQQAEALGVQLVDLDELFRRCDVVSVHAPRLPETIGMISGRHLEMMKHRASFINTARGAVVREQEMIDVLRRRPDLQAVLDVTHPEPPEPGSPLYQLPNVMLTPHIAGSHHIECRRMGRFMVEELKRYIAGETLQWQITQQQAAILA
ncbi:MAG: hydroxyacid dehydrogenase [Phycisphaeraceae bacterium]|nr:hydroxyacid dehydrogenase [Phycisphaeraceae bacterium]